MLRVCTSSTSYQLTTVQAVKDLLRTTSTADDTLLDALVSRASGAIELYLGRPLLRQHYSETVPGFGGQNIMVTVRPIIHVDAVFPSTGAASLGTSEYIVDAEAGLISRNPGGWPWSAGIDWTLEGSILPGSERPIYQVDYEAGYIFPGTSDEPRTLPYPIEQAALDIIQDWYLFSRRDPTIESKRVGDLAITYKTGGSANGPFPQSAMYALDLLKTVV
jgi:hypothetical protein